MLLDHALDHEVILKLRPMAALQLTGVVSPTAEECGWWVSSLRLGTELGVMCISLKL